MNRDNNFWSKYYDFIHDATPEIKQEKKDICDFLIGFFGLTKNEASNHLKTAIADVLKYDGGANKEIELKSSFSKLVRKIAKNNCLREKKQSSNRKKWEENYLQIQKLSEQDSEEKLYREELWEFVKNNLKTHISDELTVRVISERHIEGKSYKQIQKDLMVDGVNKTIINLRKIMSRGLMKLRKNLENTSF